MKNILNTTLGYLEKDGKWLMLHRTKKEQDLNAGKWIGIGGKLEPGETVLECMKRECLEETGLNWQNPIFRGIVTFNYQSEEEQEITTEQMFLFAGGSFSGEQKECLEGNLEWIPVEELSGLNLWEGDRIFIELLLSEHPFFFLKLNYRGNHLISHQLSSSAVLS